MSFRTEMVVDKKFRRARSSSAALVCAPLIQPPLSVRTFESLKLGQNTPSLKHNQVLYNPASDRLELQCADCTVPTTISTLDAGLNTV